MLSRLTTRRPLRQAGDTIIEVLIALAVLAMAFVISYATANHAILSARMSEEHSEALQIIDAQIEDARAAVAVAPDSVFVAGKSFCMTSSSSSTIISSFIPQASVDPLTPVTEYPQTCIQGRYFLSNVYRSSGGNDYITFHVRWFGIGTSGIQEEELAYKIHPQS